MASGERFSGVHFIFPSYSALGVSALGGSHMARMPFAELPYPVYQESLWIGCGYLGDRNPMHYPTGSLG